MFAEAAWLDGTKLVAELGRVAERFGLAGARERTAEDAVKFLRRELHGQAVLLVIDNVDPQHIDLRHLPIAGGRSRTLITSRAVTLDQDVGAGATSVHLDRWKKTRCRVYFRTAVPALEQAPAEELDALSAPGGFKSRRG